MMPHNYPKSVIRPTYIYIRFFLWPIDVILAFLSASCPYCHLAVARYSFDNNMTNLLATNTNLASILMTDLELFRNLPQKEIIRTLLRYTIRHLIVV